MHIKFHKILKSIFKVFASYLLKFCLTDSLFFHFRLFPSKVQPLMNIFSCAIFGLLVRLQLCKPFVRHIDIAHLDHINVLLPGLQTRDTERRRYVLFYS